MNGLVKIYEPQENKKIEIYWITRYYFENLIKSKAEETPKVPQPLSISSPKVENELSITRN